MLNLTRRPVTAAMAAAVAGAALAAGITLAARFTQHHRLARA